MAALKAGQRMHLVLPDLQEFSLAQTPLSVENNDVVFHCAIHCSLIVSLSWPAFLQ